MDTNVANVFRIWVQKRGLMGEHIIHILLHSGQRGL